MKSPIFESTVTTLIINSTTVYHVKNLFPSLSILTLILIWISLGILLTLIIDSFYSYDLRYDGSTEFVGMYRTTQLLVGFLILHSWIINVFSGVVASLIAVALAVIGDQLRLKYTGSYYYQKLGYVKIEPEELSVLKSFSCIDLCAVTKLSFSPAAMKEGFIFNMVFALGLVSVSSFMLFISLFTRKDSRIKEWGGFWIAAMLLYITGTLTYHQYLSALDSVLFLFISLFVLFIAQEKISVAVEYYSTRTINFND